MSKPLTMTVERMEEARFAATGGENCSVSADRVAELLVEVDALRAALAAAKAKLEQERKGLSVAEQISRLMVGTRFTDAEAQMLTREIALRCFAARRAARDGQEGTR